MLYYRKPGVLPAAPGCPRLFPERLFFLGAKLIHAQELGMTLVCSEESKLPQTSISISARTSISISISTSNSKSINISISTCEAFSTTIGTKMS